LQKSLAVSFFSLCVGAVLASFSCLAARITPDREFPAVLCRHPDMQLRLQLRMPAEHLLPVGDLASRDSFGISVEDILDGQPVSTRPGGNGVAGFQVTQQDLPKPPRGTVDLGRLTGHALSPILFRNSRRACKTHENKDGGKYDWTRAGRMIFAFFWSAWE